LPLLFLHCHQSGIESLFLLSVLLAVLLWTQDFSSQNQTTCRYTLPPRCLFIKPARVTIVISIFFFLSCWSRQLFSLCF
jgi:hypothetical protein